VQSKLGEQTHTVTFEIIDVPTLARRWCLPASWVYEQVRSRASDPLPCLRLGRYVRFEWASPALETWLARHRSKN
jgi:hypothetical protein